MTGRWIESLTRAMVGLLAVSLAGVSVVRADATVHAPPDSAQVAELRARIAKERVIRIIGPRGVRDIFRPEIGSIGITPAGPGAGGRRRPALFLVGELPPAPARTPVPWSDISEIQVGGGAAGRGFLLGTVAAMGIAATVLIAEPRRTRGFGDPRYLWVAAPLPLLGFVIGSKLGWRTVYAEEG